jgi:heme-degrading monooxygenase HmoA
MNTRSHRSPTKLLPLLALLLAGCNEADQDDDGSTTQPAEPSVDQRLRELADCEATDAVQLLPWSGPAFDPTTGALLAPLPEGHVEAVVNGWRRRDPEAQALREQYGMQVFNDVFTRDGLLGFEAVESDLCDISISHTLWRDEASMLAFVRGEAHVEAMRAAPQMHFFAIGAHWAGDARERPPSWRSGVKRMTEELLAGSR